MHCKCQRSKSLCTAGASWLTGERENLAQVQALGSPLCLSGESGCLSPAGPRSSLCDLGLDRGFQAAQWKIRNPNPVQDWGMPVHLWSTEPGTSLTRALGKEMGVIKEKG